MKVASRKTRRMESKEEGTQTSRPASKQGWKVAGEQEGREARKKERKHTSEQASKKSEREASIQGCKHARREWKLSCRLAVRHGDKQAWN